ncbi:transcriptional protein SWT1 [Chelonus insularis]|uniref:transcriptional protein SWT1 n=1 Tax=Chelonus insularis TaxID=460826 RepID=UPI00158D7902|nr:transcriptional protein SWT1-like [Chelonus insularis]
MKRKSQQDTMVSKIPKTSLSPSSSIINLDDDNNGDKLNTKSVSNTTKKSPIHDIDEFVIKIEKADSECEGKPKLAIEKVTDKKSVTSSSSSEIVQVLHKSKPRMQLRAKRQCTSKELKQKEPIVEKKKQQKIVVVKEEKDSTETMQMKLLREKIKLRQAQGNAPKKSKIIKEIEIKKEPSPTMHRKKSKKSNNEKLRTIEDNSELISRKIKQELIDIDNQSNGDKDFDKICKLKNVIKKIDQNNFVPDNKSTIGKFKKNTTSVSNEISADSKSLMESSKYVIPKIKKNFKTDINSNQENKLNHDGQQNRLSSAPSNPKMEVQYYKNAEERMKALRSRLSAEIEINKARVATASKNVSNENKVDSFYEEMEWEPIEEEQVICEVQAIRAQLGIGENDIQMKELSDKNSNELTVNIDHAVIYIVVDTNVLLSSIETIGNLCNTSFGIRGKPTIIIPWTVIRELDYIKDDKKNTSTERLKSNARRAVNFLYYHFSKKHPQIKGQKYQDSVNNRTNFALECPDDEILQTCLQIRSSNSLVFLLSFDKNLCNKAMIHDLTVLGKEDSIEKINKTLQKINNPSRRGRVKKENVAIKEEIKTEDEIKILNNLDALNEIEKSPFNIEDIYEETKDMLTAFLTVIVSSELKNTFGDEWEKYTTLKPPWTAITVLKCATKYFIVVVSESFSTKAEPILKTLLQLITKLENNVRKQLKEIQHIIELFNDLIQYVNDVNKYQHILRRSIAAIQELRNKCMERLKQQADVENRNAEINLTKEEQEMKATKAFKCFENIYRFTRNFCGSALEIAGLPCSFQFNKEDLNDEFIKRNCPNIVGNLNQIIRALSNILENISELRINHINLIELYELITTFLGTITDESISDQILPEDIYYCLKYKEANLKLGFEQFLELSNHFAAIARSNSIQ